MLQIILASGFLLLVAGAGALIICHQLPRAHYTPRQLVLLFVILLLARLLWRTRIVGQFPLSTGQGGVIVANHRSSADPFFIQVAAGRPVHWMVAAEFFRHPLFGFFLRQCETIPARRGGVDTAAIKAAIRIVQHGGLVGMFPEGRINMTEQLLLPGRPGAAMIAARAGVPLVPCYIAGAPYRGTPWGPFRMTARVRVTLGTPIASTPADTAASPAEWAEELTRRCLHAIAQLAGRPDQQPQLAGRHWRPTPEQITRDLHAARNRQWK